jgi:hypothetical protein
MGHLQGHILGIFGNNITGEADRNMTAELCIANTSGGGAVKVASEDEEH